MVEMHTRSDPPILPPKIETEVTLIFLLQLVLIVGLVWIDKAFSLFGSLHALVGVVFILLPVIVLDRRDKPYARYGLHRGRPLGDLGWAIGAMVLTFTPLVFASPVFWGIADRSWQFAWPDGYPSVALSHLIVVALPEEFFYRGYLMGRLNDIFRGRIRLLGAEVGWALLIQAAAFAVGHYLTDFNPSRLGVFFPALAFGWLRAKRGSIGAPIFFHAASNIFMEILRTGYGL